MLFNDLFLLYKTEFSNYSFEKFRGDVFAGITVTAVALPLALAFGVASGASAAAGLVTAVVAGFVIGILSGAPYQISGPTGAMSAVLILLVTNYGLHGVWIAGLISGLLLLVIGLLRLGRFISFIPAPVISGFTSGIALLIFIGQIDNFLGVKTPAAESALVKLAGYFQGGFQVNIEAVVLGVVVIAVMLLWPEKWNARFPSSLLGIIVATGLTALLHWQVALIGKIPQTLLLDERLNFMSIDWTSLPQYIAPALTITALGAIESLLCGAVASNMTGVRLNADQELIGQGIGNMIIPFFGGVPATAAIARTSVGIKSGGHTRLVSIIHSFGLLLSIFLLAPIMGQVPLVALAGVLMVTAWRMNEWHAIRYIFQHRFKTAIFGFLITMLATVALDLTQAILAGTFISGALFLSQIARIRVEMHAVDANKLREKGIEINGDCNHTRVAYVSGPLFFASSDIFNEALAELEETHVLILSMRGVPMIDTAGLEVLERLHSRLNAQGGVLMLSGVQRAVCTMMERGSLKETIGANRFFWSSDQAIVAAEEYDCPYCE